MTARLMERHPRRCPKGAFTLVEMLIAMALTLIMVGAIAEFYAYVGETVKDGRAMIEINGLMRAAVQRLKSDLDSVTAQAIPWADEGSGYITIFEGATYIPGTTTTTIYPASDADANGNLILDSVESVGSTTTPSWAQLGISNLIGDGDDILAMTIRANGQPLTGRFYDTATGTHKIITAQHAEVIWWTGFTDIAPPGASANGAWDLNEPRQVYRRQLLIRPDLGRLVSTSGYALSVTGLTGTGGALQALKDWFQVSDVSASIRVEPDSTGTQKFFIRANSLADLSRPEYRFGHIQYTVSSGNLVDNFPYPFIFLVPSTSAASAGVTTGNSMALQNAAVFVGYSSPIPTQSTSEGEDIILSNVLAFDVRVYDPQAQIKPDDVTLPGTALTPGDPGYLDAAFNSRPSIGTGAFVDLAYGVQMFNMLQTPSYGLAAAAAQTKVGNAVGSSYFAASNNYYAGVGTRPALGAVWDTWTWWYERDGLNQDYVADGVANINTPPFDEGTNGLDDDGVNGVDDAGEREANPPYARALRGLEVKIRMYEPGTRQVRQATVGTDFVAE